MDWDWDRTVAKETANVIAESKYAQGLAVGNQHVLLDAIVDWNQ